MEENNLQLRELLKNIPSACSQLNIKKLGELFFEYKFIIDKLPGKFAPVKNLCENNYYQVKTKIDSAIETRNSWSRKKFFFEEACISLRQEIETVILHINTG